MNLRLKRPPTLWQQFWLVFALTIVLDISFRFDLFKSLLQEMSANPSRWWELLFVLGYWTVDALIFTLIFRAVFRRLMQSQDKDD